MQPTTIQRKNSRNDVNTVAGDMSVTLYVTHPTQKMLIDASLAPLAAFSEVSRSHQWRGIPTVLVLHPYVTDGLISGRIVIAAINHFTSNVLHDSHIEPSSHDTPEGRRYNWALVVSLCAAKLQYFISRPLHNLLLAGDSGSILEATHEVAIRCHGGAFGANELLRQSTNRQRALLEPLQKQVALMAIQIHKDQSQLAQMQQAQNYLLHLGESLFVTLADESERRSEIEWSRELFFWQINELLTLSLRETDRRQKIALLEGKERKIIQRTETAEREPMIILNLLEAERQVAVDIEGENRQEILIQERAMRDTVVQLHWLILEEGATRIELLSLETIHYDDIVRRIYCYFETIVGTDALRIQESARREVLTSYWLRVLLQVGKQFKEKMSKPKARPKTKKVSVTVAPTFNTNDTNRTERLRAELEAEDPNVVLRKNTLGDIRLRGFIGAKVPQSLRHFAVGITVPVEPAEFFSRTDQAESQVVEPNNEVPANTCHPLQKPTSRSRRWRDWQTEYEEFSVWQQRVFVEKVSAGHPIEPRSGLPPAPPSTAAPPLQCNPSPDEVPGEVRWHRNHLSHYREIQPLLRIQAFFSFQRSVRLLMKKFYRKYRRSMKYVAIRLKFRLLLFPKLYIRSVRLSKLMALDGIVFNKSIERITYPKGYSAKEPPKHLPHEGLIAVSAISKLSACVRCFPLLHVFARAYPRYLRRREQDSSTVNQRQIAQDTFERNILTHTNNMCHYCSDAVELVIRFDLHARYRQALKGLLVAHSLCMETDRKIRVRCRKKEEQMLAEENDLTALQERVVSLYPCLHSRRRYRTTISLIEVQKMLRWRRSSLQRCWVQHNSWILSRRRNPRILSIIMGVQMQWRRIVSRRRRQRMFHDPQYGVPCRCSSVLEVFLRRLQSSWSAKVPEEFQKKFGTRRRILSLKTIQYLFEPWIILHTSPQSLTPGLKATLMRGVEHTFIDKECIESREKFVDAVQEWQVTHLYGVWILYRLRFRIYLRRAKRTDPERFGIVDSGCLNVIGGVKQATSKCKTGRFHQCQRCRPILDIFNQRVRKFPGFVVLESFQRKAAHFRSLVCRTCASCQFRWSSIVDWAKDLWEIANFVHLRFRFVIQQRNKAELEYREFTRQKAGEQYNKRDDWMLCKVPCSLFLQELRKRLTHAPMLNRSKIQGYLSFICSRCIVSASTTVKPYVECRDACRLLQSWFRWRREWRQRAAVNSNMSIKSRIKCTRCEPIVEVLRRRVQALIATGEDFPVGERKNYENAMCSSSCAQSVTGQHERLRRLLGALQEVDMSVAHCSEVLRVSRKLLLTAEETSELSTLIRIKRAPAQGNCVLVLVQSAVRYRISISLKNKLSKRQHQNELPVRSQALSKERFRASRNRVSAATASLLGLGNLLSELELEQEIDPRNARLNCTPPSHLQVLPVERPESIIEVNNIPPSFPAEQNEIPCKECGEWQKPPRGEWCQICGAWLIKPPTPPPIPFRLLGRKAGPAPTPSIFEHLLSQSKQSEKRPKKKQPV